MNDLRDYSVVRVEADLDTNANCEEMNAGLQKFYDAGKRKLAVDLSIVKVINTFGIGKLLFWHQRMKTEGGEFKVVGCNGFVREAFEATLLSRIFQLEPQAAPPQSPMGESPPESAV